MHQVRLVGGGHDDEARQAAEIGEVEGAGVGRAVGADQAGAVHGEAHRQPLDRDVVHHLVVGALQEGRVDRAERLVAFGRKPGGEGHRVLLGDADVEGALREDLLEQIDAGAGRHGGGDADDLVVLLGFLDQALAEHLLVGRRVRLGLGLDAGRDVELDHAVIFVGGVFRRRVALALLRPAMDEDRPGLAVAHVLQDRQQLIEVVAVDRADVVEAELLEQRAAGHHAAGEFLGAQRADFQRLRQLLGELLADLAQRAIGAAGEQARQIARHRADRRRDRHVVVVEDDDQARIHRAGVVHGLVGHAGRQRAVADHGDRRCSCCRTRSRATAMPSADEIEVEECAAPNGSYSLSARLVKPDRPLPMPQRADAVAAAGEDLVRIGLMADVPDQPVVRRVEHVVQGDRQFDHAEARRRDGRR